jgi:hypothetical protein
MKANGPLLSPSLYPQGKNPLYPFDRRLGGPQNRSGRHEEEKNHLPLQIIEPKPLSHRACSLVAMPTISAPHAEKVFSLYHHDDYYDDDDSLEQSPL